MAYVDLNPIRAGIVKELQHSLYTSIKKRLDELHNSQSDLTRPIKAIAGGVSTQRLNINLSEYIQLIEWAGKSTVHPAKASMPDLINTLLSTMNLQPNNWLSQINHFNKDSPHSIGCLSNIKKKAESLHKIWIKGVTRSRLMYLKA
jgi:putative transposase